MTVADTFKEAASLFASGVTVVAAKGAEGVHGTTVSAFTSLSLEPSMVLVCLAHASRVLPLIRESGMFTVSVLGAEQKDVAMGLSKSARAIGEGMDGLHIDGPETGCPVVKDCLSYFECTLREEIIGGDHAILLGHVEGAGRGGASEPLLYFNREFRRLA